MNHLPAITTLILLVAAAPPAMAQVNLIPPQIQNIRAVLGLEETVRCFPLKL